MVLITSGNIYYVKTWQYQLTSSSNNYLLVLFLFSFFFDFFIDIYINYTLALQHTI